MSITLEQAKKLEYRDIIHDGEFFNADGSCQRWRVNGKVQVWKRSPDKVRVPIKRGLREFGYLHETNLEYFHPEGECKNVKQ